MVRYSEGWVSDSTFRLFLVECCRRVAHLMRDRRSLDALEVAEAFARYIGSPERLAAAHKAAEQAAKEANDSAREAELRVINAIDAEVWRELGARAFASRAAAGVAAPRAAAVVLDAAGAAADAAGTVAEDLWDAAREEEEAWQCALLRVVVGRPPRSAPSAITS